MRYGNSKSAFPLLTRPYREPTVLICQMQNIHSHISALDFYIYIDRNQPFKKLNVELDNNCFPHAKDSTLTASTIKQPCLGNLGLTSATMSPMFRVCCTSC